jgi:hypothetical protein
LRFLVFLVLCGALSAANLRYWVEPCTEPANGCHAADPELAQWALEAWQAASSGHLTFEKTADREKAHIRIFWTGGREGLYGEARPIVVDGVRGAEVYVLPAPGEPGAKDALMRDAVVYLTCLHETGHALGLPHTAQFADIMYSFQYGGDISEYFGRYRRQLAARRDIRQHSGMSPEDRKVLLGIYK